MEPSVSVPMAKLHSAAAVADAGPAELPELHHPPRRHIPELRAVGGLSFFGHGQFRSRFLAF